MSRTTSGPSSSFCLCWIRFRLGPNTFTSNFQRCPIFFVNNKLRNIKKFTENSKLHLNNGLFIFNLAPCDALLVNLSKLTPCKKCDLIQRSNTGCIQNNNWFQIADRIIRLSLLHVDLSNRLSQIRVTFLPTIERYVSETSLKFWKN